MALLAPASRRLPNPQCPAGSETRNPGAPDNVGSDEYNQKLSESRADAVVAWLNSTGIAQARLTAHGYGMKQPIADNGSDKGRARNRRIELKKQVCAAQ